MLISPSTEARIVKAMEHGAVLCFHWRGFYDWGEWDQRVTRVTLTHGERSLLLSPAIEDVYHFDYRTGEPRTIIPDTLAYLTRQSCYEITKRADVRDDYLPGSRWEGCTCWVERYVHISTPTPHWVTEQWGFDEFGNPDGDHRLQMKNSS